MNPRIISAFLPPRECFPIIIRYSVRVLNPSKTDTQQTPWLPHSLDADGEGSVWVFGDTKMKAFLLAAGITIVHIFAVILFIMPLMLLSFAAYSKGFLGMASKLLNNKDAIKKAWLAILVWIVLMIWVLYVLFA